MKQISIEQAIKLVNPPIEPQGLSNIARYWADSITQTEEREIYPDADFII